MSDKRAACRVRRRLPVTFSDGKQTHRGTTANLSRTGACIHSDYVVMPGTEVQITIGLPGIADVRIKAYVEWARKLRGSETLAAGHSMGLRYLSPPGPDYHDFMSVIEGLAQPHGLTTKAEAPAAPPPAAPPPPRAATPRPTTGRRAALRDPHRIDLDSVELQPVPELVMTREPEARPTRPHTPRRLPHFDPRREPEVAPARPRREIEVIAIPAVVEEVQQRPAPNRGRPEQRLDFVVTENDLAAPGGYRCSLSTARVAWLLEQGAAELIAPRLKGRTTTVGVSLEVSVPNEPVDAGTALDVVVTMTAIGADRRSFGFELSVREGDRLVASGKHVRQLIEPA